MNVTRRCSSSKTIWRCKAAEVVARPIRVCDGRRCLECGPSVPSPSAGGGHHGPWLAAGSRLGLEGFKCLERLLEIDPAVKVIVLTGQNDQSNALRAVRMGAYDFLAKPVDPDV